MPTRPSAPRLSRHASRRAVLWGLGFVVALHLALAGAMETVLPEWRDPEYCRRLQQVREWKARYPHRPLGLAFGSSRTQMGFSPKHMAGEDGPLLYNFGVSASGPVQMAMTFRRLRDDGVTPDFVLLEFMPAAFIPDAPAEELMKPWMTKLSHADLGRLRDYSESPTRFEAAWAETRLNPWYTMRFTLMSHWQPGWLPWQLRQAFMWTLQDPWGWLPYVHETVPAETRTRNIATMARSYEAALKDVRIGKWPAKAYRDLLAECRAAGIPAALFVMPESPTFRGWYSPESWQRSQAFRDGVARDAGAPVFDATAGFVEEDFADGHHMLQSGAAKFSARLWSEHVKPWLAK